MTHAALVTIQIGERSKTFGLRPDTIVALSQDFPPYPKDRRVEDLILSVGAALKKMRDEPQ